MTEPKHIKTILPAIMKSITDNCNRRRAAIGLPPIDAKSEPVGVEKGVGSCE